MAVTSRILTAAASLCLTVSGVSQAQSGAAGTERLNAQMQNAAKPPPPPAATPNPNCTLIVPANPLTAAGLATPYQLVATDPGQGPCNESNTAQSAFVQAAIFDPATATISVYSRYCRQLLRIAPPRMLANQKALTAFASPDTGAANSLYTFLAQRFTATYQLLNCATLVNTADPVGVSLNGQGVAVSVSINSQQLNQIAQKLAPFQAEDDARDSVERSRQSTE